LKRNRRHVLLLLLPFAGFLIACNPVRFVPDGDYLLRKNTLSIDTTSIAKDGLEVLIKQQPNKKLLGIFYPYVWFYETGSRGKENGLKRWLKEIGEAPAKLDTALTHRSRNQMDLYMKKHGFFNAQVIDSTSIDHRYAHVRYVIKTGTPYVLGKIDFSTKDTMLSGLVTTIASSTTLKKGNLYDEELFEKERERITGYLKSMGYYSFSKNYITFKADSSLGSHTVNLVIFLNRVNENQITGEKQDPQYHHPYHFRNIYIQPDFDPKNPEASIPRDTVAYQDLSFLSANGSRTIKEKTIANCLFFRRDDLFNQQEINYSYQRIQNLNVFKYINMNFKEVPRDSVQKDYLLDGYLLMSTMARQDFTIETDATNTGGNLGLGGSFGYRNKNLFRGAEMFEFRIRGGVQSLPNFTDSTIEKKLFFFNTYQIGPEITIQLKKFLLPEFILHSMTKNLRRMNPRTVMTSGYDLQDRPDYRRSILKLSLGYTWRTNERKSFAFSPVDINSVYVKKSTAFQAQLDSLRDPKLQYSYDTHLISAMHFTYVFSNQRTPNSNFLYARANFETAGLLLNGLARTFDFPKDAEGIYHLAGIPYAEYVKPELDISYHHVMRRSHTVVYRLYTGVGIPYANSKALPFEKSFFAGGANSMRAWVAYTLGPGSYVNNQGIEQSGDIKLESNLEVRSHLLSFMGTSTIESALFADIGNIWTLNADVVRPGAQFQFDTFSKQLAIGSGLGLRFNFNFFILRLDMAVKVLDPGLEKNQKWVYSNQKFMLKDITPNLAIGYPF
jgi:outer membrane protein assembly factor BamA